MGDYDNDVRRYQQGHPYFKQVDGIYRQNVRRVVAVQGDADFQLTPDDAILIVNTEAGVNANVRLPLLTSCAKDQRFIIMNCDPTGASGASVTINPFTGSDDPINEVTPAPGVVITLPNEVREFVRGLTIDFDSWYTLCCSVDLV